MVVLEVMKTLQRLALLMCTVTALIFTFSSYLSTSNLQISNVEATLQTVLRQQLPAATGKAFIAEKIRTFIEKDDDNSGGNPKKEIHF